MRLAPVHPSKSPRASAGQLVPGTYCTDGLRLFRVVSQFADDTQHAFASLEDCLTLEVRPYAPGELYRMGLRPLRGRE